MNTLRVLSIPLCLVGLLGSSSALQQVEVVSFDKTQRGQPTPLVLPLADALQSNTETISVSVGGEQRMFLDAGAAHANELYFVLGSLTGTWPGLVTQGGQILPLNPDIYLQMTSLGSNPQLKNQIGFLDRAGKAQAGFSIKPVTFMQLAGVEVNHAFVTIDLRQGRITAASNPLGLQLVP